MDLIFHGPLGMELSVDRSAGIPRVKSAEHDSPALLVVGRALTAIEGVPVGEIRDKKSWLAVVAKLQAPERPLSLTFEAPAARRDLRHEAPGLHAPRPPDARSVLSHGGGNGGYRKEKVLEAAPGVAAPAETDDESGAPLGDNDNDESIGAAAPPADVAPGSGGFDSMASPLRPAERAHFAALSEGDQEMARVMVRLRQEPAADPAPEPAADPAPEPAADPAQAWPAAFFELQKLQKEIAAVYTTPGYGKNTRIGDVRSILDVYGFTNRGRSWERDSLRLYPPENFPQSQEGCIRSFNGLKTYLDSALAEASPSHP